MNTPATRTLGEINTALSGLQLPPLNQAQAAKLAELHPKARFLAVLDGAVLGKPESRQVLVSMLNDVQAGAPQGQRPAPAPAQEGGDHGESSRQAGAGGTDGQGVDRNRKQIRAYSMKSGVIIFEASTDRNGAPSLMIEAAPRLDGARQGKPRPGEKCYDYDRKIVFSVMENELPQLFAFLHLYTEQINFRFHGEDKSKALHLKWQGGPENRTLFARMRGNGGMVAIPIEAAAANHIALLCAEVFQARYPGVDAAIFLRLAQAHGPTYQAIAAKNQDSDEHRKAG